MSVIRTINTVAKFNKELEKVFASFGVVFKEDSDIRDEEKVFELKTPYGTLKISPDNKPDKGRTWSIFMRFESDWKQKELLEQLGEHSNINKYSGKWNIHRSTSELAIDIFEWKMNQLGLEPKTA